MDAFDNIIKKRSELLEVYSPDEIRATNKGYEIVDPLLDDAAVLEPEAGDAESGFFDVLKDVAVNVGDLPNMLVRGSLNALGEAAYSSGLIDKDQADVWRNMLKTSGKIAEGEGVNPLARGLGEGLSQFGAGMFGPFKVLKAMGFARPIAAIISEGIAGAFAFNPDDPNLGNFINSFEGRPEWLGPMADFIETDPDDSEAENRFRNLIQDVVPSAAVEAIVLGVRAIRGMDADTLIKAGEKAEERLASQMSGATLSANPIGTAGDAIVAETGKLAKRIKGSNADSDMGPRRSQIDMRLRQMTFENDIRSGEINLDDPKVDLDEVLAIQTDNLTPEVSTLVDASPAVKMRALSANAAQLRRTIPSTGGKGRRTVEDVGKFFDENHLEINGRKLDPTNPADIEIATNQAVADIQFQLTQAVTGKGWYVKDIDEAFMTASKIPGMKSLANNRTHRIIMSALMGPTSNGKRVPFNFKVGTYNMRQWLKDGTIPMAKVDDVPPPGLGLGISAAAIKKNMRLIEFLINKFGPDDFADWWLTPHTLGELRALRKESGLLTGPANVTGKSDVMVMGGKIIGEKTGNFTLAMNGFDVTTKDRWNIRNYNRLFGQTTDPKDLKGVLGDTGLIDQLRNPAEGREMDAFWAEVAKRTNLDEKDTQAIAWYFEQFLYNDLGIVSAIPESFSDAAKKVFANRDSIGGNVAGGNVRTGNVAGKQVKPRGSGTGRGKAK